MTTAVHVSQDETRLHEEICRIAPSIFACGLAAGSSGNIRVRLGDCWLIAPTNASPGRLLPEQRSKLDRDGRHISGNPPSNEAVLHRAMYAARTGCRAIVHGRRSSAQPDSRAQFPD